MKRSILLLLILSIFTNNYSFGQSVEKLPVDPRIKVGQLANGLSYYIVPNDVMEGYADFYLVQKVGFASENLDQKGMTAFLCNMGLRGTRNFPGTTIIDYLEGLGMNLKNDLEISVGPDESLFRISNVPISKSKSVFDSTLLILYNWSCAINIDEEDLEKEKVYFENDYVSKMTASKRSEEMFKQWFFKETIYCPPSPFSTLEQMKTFSTKDLRNHYYKWFRPDLQAVVIVGDIESAAVETQIKTLFQASPKMLKPARRHYEKMPDDKGVLVATYSEKEIQTAKVSLYLKGDLIPPSLRLSAVPYVEGYMNYILEYLVEDRVKGRLYNENFPTLACSTTFENFFERAETEALKIEVETDVDSVERALTYIVEEMKDIKDNGFSRDEFRSASQRFKRNIQYLYDWRGLISSDIFAQRCINNYLLGFSLASIELYKEYMDKVFMDVNIDHINTYAKSFIRFDNSAVTCSYHDSGEIESVRADSLINIVRNANYSSIRTSGNRKRELNFESGSITPGTIVSETKEPISKSSLYTLSNGATVVVKTTQTEPQTINFKAVAKGGLSLYSGLNPVTIKYINHIASISKIGNFNSYEISEACKDLGITLSKKISLSLNQIEGKCGSNDLNRFLELVHYHFSEIEKDSVAFTKFINEELIRNKYSSFSPEYLFEDSLWRNSYKFNEQRSFSSDNMIDGLNYDKIISFLKERFSNAANYTFIIVGDVDEIKTKELICKYIGSLPGNPNKRDTWRIIPYYLNKSDKTINFKTEMDYSRSLYRYSISGPSHYNVEDVVISEFILKIIDNRITEKLNEMGVPSTITFDLKKYPEEFLIINISYITKTYSEMFQDQISQELRRISKDGVPKEQIDYLRSSLVSRYQFAEMGNNSFWIDIITNRFIYGKDFYTKYLQLVKTIPATTINERLKSFIENSNEIEISLSPENEHN